MYILLSIFLFIVLSIIGGILVWIHVSIRLERLNNNINDISSRQVPDDMCRVALHSFLYEYKFDYAVISLIDHSKRFIYSTFYDSNNPLLEEADPKNWVKHSNYPLSHDDILVKIIKGEQRVKVVGRKVHDEGKQITFADLNLEIFTTYKHERLARLFLPVVYREQSRLGDKAVEHHVVLGVIEVGFVHSWRNYLQKISRQHSVSRIVQFWFGNTFRVFFRQDTITLQLYINNFAQSYFRALVKQGEENSAIFNQEKPDNTQPYREQILKETANLIGADSAVLAFKSIENESLRFNHKANSFYNVGEKDILPLNQPKVNGLEQLVIDSGHSYLNEDLASTVYIPLVFAEPVQSVLVVPLKLNTDVVGLLAFFSHKKKWFNLLHQYETEGIAERLLDVYNERRARMAYDALLPSGSWSEPEEIYKNVIKALTHYYNTRAIGVWRRGQDSLVLQKDLSTDEISHYFPDDYQTNAQLNPTFFQSQLSASVLLIRAEERSSTSEWWRINISLSNPYVAVIILGIQVQNQLETILTIYLKQAPAQFDRQFPRQVAQKIALALLNTRLSQAFRSLTQINSEHPSERLQQVVNVAKAVTNADSVSLFPYTGTTIKIGDGIVAGYSVLEAEKARDAFVANLLINSNKPDNWFSSPDDYFTQIEVLQGKPVSDLQRQNSAWIRMKLASTAAFIVSTEAVILGVMFFNFKTSMNFNAGSDARRFIKLFVGLTSVQLQNLNLVASIEGKLASLTVQQQKAERAIGQLEEERSRIEAQRASIQFDYEEIYRKMENMVPLSQQVLFLNIMRGVNHDVRHLLNDLHVTFETDTSGKLTSKADEVSVIAQNIESILDLFNFNTFKTEFIDLNSIIRNVVNLFSSRVRGRVRFEVDELDEQIPPLKSNKAEFSMMIYNLINNAVSAIYKVGKQHRGEIRLTTQLINKKYLITVTDNGCGIPNEIQDIIFEPGFTTKSNGLGIGLFFVKELVEKKFLGTISFKTILNKGTIFTIFIPEYLNYQSEDIHTSKKNDT